MLNLADFQSCSGEKRVLAKDKEGSWDSKESRQKTLGTEGEAGGPEAWENCGSRTRNMRKM